MHDITFLRREARALERVRFPIVSYDAETLLMAYGIADSVDIFNLAPFSTDEGRSERVILCELAALVLEDELPARGDV